MLHLDVSRCVIAQRVQLVSEKYQTKTFRRQMHLPNVLLQILVKVQLRCWKVTNLNLQFTLIVLCVKIERNLM